MGGMDGYQGSIKHGGGMNKHEWVQEECRGYGQVPGGSNRHGGWYERVQWVAVAYYMAPLPFFRFFLLLFLVIFNYVYLEYFNEKKPHVP